MYAVILGETEKHRGNILLVRVKIRLTSLKNPFVSPLFYFSPNNETSQLCGIMRYLLIVRIFYVKFYKSAENKEVILYIFKILTSQICGAFSDKQNGIFICPVDQRKTGLSTKN